MIGRVTAVVAAVVVAGGERETGRAGPERTVDCEE